MEDFRSDFESSQKLTLPFDRFILAPTFRDDAQLQEEAGKIQRESGTTVNLYYWGWDTLSKYAEQHESILKKYLSKFMPKPTKTPKQAPPELPEGALGKELHKYNYSGTL